MKFYSVTGEVMQDPDLAKAFKAAHKIGVLSIGDEYLFFGAKLKTYVIPFAVIRRVFRRVQLVHARMCCGQGNLTVENIVVCGDEGELAQVQLPGEKAAKAAIAELKEKLPQVDFTAPAKADTEAKEA